MMRPYSFIDGDIRKLEGWTYCEDRGDGNGPCLYREGTTFPADYPDAVLLVTPVGTAWQVCPLVDGEHVEALHEAATRAGLAVYRSAKELAAAKPTLAASHLREQETVSGPDVAVLDKDGKPVLDRGIPVFTPTWTTQPKPGAPLQVAMCLAGDDAVAAADPTEIRGALVSLRGGR